MSHCLTDRELCISHCEANRELCCSALSAGLNFHQESIEWISKGLGMTENSYSGRRWDELHTRVYKNDGDRNHFKLCDIKRRIIEIGMFLRFLSNIFYRMLMDGTFPNMFEEQ